MTPDPDHVRAIQAAGGLLPGNWVWLNQPAPHPPGDLALVLAPAAARAFPPPAAEPARLLTHPGTPRQRCTPWSGSLPEHDDWLLLVGSPAGPNLWEQRPLYGQRIAVTREPSQATDLTQQLQQLGAEVIACPVLRFVRPDTPPRWDPPGSYDWVIFTSSNGVRCFFDLLWGVGHDTRALSRAQLAAIGPGTAAALEARGLRADLVPGEFIAEGLLEAFASHRMDGARILLPRAQEARDTLPDGLRARGARVDVVPVYKTVLPEPPPHLQQADWVVLMSSSAARNFRQIAPQADPRCLCIGPVTAATARSQGFTRITQAERHDLQGVVEALLAACRQPRL